MVINQPQFTPKTKNKVSPIVLMGAFAVGLGLIAAIGIGQYLSKSQVQTKAPADVMKAVVVASHDILPGSKLSEKDLTIKEFPAQTVPADYPTAVNLIIGREVKNPLLKEEVVTEAKLVPIVVASGLPTLLPPGMRAITIKVNEISGVSGFIKPGDYVDVLSIYRNRDDVVCRSVFENLLVVGVGDKLLDPKAAPDVAPRIVSQLTLAVSPEDAEKLFLTSTTGQFQLSLRAFGDKGLIASQGTYPEDIYGYVSGASHKDRGQSAFAASPKKNIELIIGNFRTYKYF